MYFPCWKTYTPAHPYICSSWSCHPNILSCLQMEQPRLCRIDCAELWYSVVWVHILGICNSLCLSYKPLCDVYKDTLCFLILFNLISYPFCLLSHPPLFTISPNLFTLSIPSLLTPLSLSPHTPPPLLNPSRAPYRGSKDPLSSDSTKPPSPQQNPQNVTLAGCLPAMFVMRRFDELLNMTATKWASHSTAFIFFSFLFSLFLYL